MTKSLAITGSGTVWRTPMTSASDVPKRAGSVTILIAAAPFSAYTAASLCSEPE
jgi:hypothetical protein